MYRIDCKVTQLLISHKLNHYSSFRWCLLPHLSKPGHNNRHNNWAHIAHGHHSGGRNVYIGCFRDNCGIISSKFHIFFFLKLKPILFKRKVIGQIRNICKVIGQEIIAEFYWLFKSHQYCSSSGSGGSSSSR